MSRFRSSLTHRVVGGMMWVAWGKAGRAILQVLVLAAMARLVAPAAFGVVSAALIFINFSTLFAQLGVGPALVQHPAPEPRHIKAGFTVSVAVGVLVTLVLWIGAPLAAKFFRVDGLVEVLRVLALSVPLRSFSVVSESLMQRDLKFRWLANRELASYAIGYGLVGIGAAFAGYGVWALVAAHTTQTLVNTGLLVSQRPPVLGLVPDRAALTELLYYGGGFTAARLANFFALQGDNLIVGRLLGPAALGFYGRAYQLVAMPATLFGEILDRVLFPTMSQLQHEPHRLAAAYYRGTALIALVMLPASVVLFVLAPDVVHVVLGPQWAATVGPLQVFAVGLLFRTSYKVSDSMVRAAALVYRRAWVQVLYALLVIAGAWIGSRWGVTGAAVGVLGAVIVNFLLLARLALRAWKGSFLSLLEVHVPAFRLAMLTGATAWLVAFALREAAVPAVFRLAVTAGAVLTLALGLVWFFPQTFLGKEGVWMLNVLRRYLPARAGALGDSRG